MYNSTVIESLLPCLAQLTLRPLLSTLLHTFTLTASVHNNKKRSFIPILQMTSSPTPLPLLLDHCYTLASTGHPNATSSLLSAHNTIPPYVILPYSSALHFILAIDCQDSQFKFKFTEIAIQFAIYVLHLSRPFSCSHLMSSSGYHFHWFVNIFDSPANISFFQNGHVVSILCLSTSWLAFLSALVTPLYWVGYTHSKSHMWSPWPCLPSLRLFPSLQPLAKSPSMTHPHSSFLWGPFGP